jgi:L-tyrosine isonitrile synthase
MTFKLHNLQYVFIVFVCLVSFAALYFLSNKYNSAGKVNRANQIYAVLEKHRITYDIDAHSVDPTVNTEPQPPAGVDALVQQIDRFVQEDKPINLLLVGFPFKSQNHEKKTLGDLPDMAERTALEYLQNIVSKIKRIYRPGAHLTIFCDGTPFAQFFMVPEDTVLAYESTLRTLTADLPDITLYTTTDLMREHNLSTLEGINTLIDTYGPNEEELKAIIAPTVLIASKRFAIEFDHAAGKEHLKKQSLEELVSQVLTRELRMRSFLSEKFPSNNFIRLTVHFSKDVGKKFGIKLSPDSDITPYHGVAVYKKNGAWAIKLKHDVDLNKYKLATKKINGIDCPFFIAKDSAEIVQ